MTRSESLGRRRFMHGAAAAGALWVVGAPARAQVADTARGAIAGAATAFLATLSAGLRRRAVFAFDDKERFNWHYVPRRREGLPLKEMSPASRAAAHELMKASLGGVGYGKVQNVIKLEGVLRQLEVFGNLLRDPDNYAVTIFGTPGPDGRGDGGWRAITSR